MTLLAALVCPTSTSAQAIDIDATIASAYRAAYNLDQEAAVRAARQVVAMAPNESRAHRALAAVLWIDILFRRGAVTIDHYLHLVPKPKDDRAQPGLEAEFKAALDRAIGLAAERVRARPDDVEATYELGSAYGLLASYQASVEDSVTAAFMSARRAFNAQEAVLEREPDRASVGVILGTYRYIVARMGLPSRMFAYALGFGGDKDKALGLLEAAAGDSASYVEARLALALIYSREGRHGDAARMLGELVDRFPDNRVFLLEQASAALRGGRRIEAERLLSAGLSRLDRATGGRQLPGERALWLYKRGIARLGLDRRTSATADFTTALANDPELWVKGRARLALGKIADLDGRRSEALAHYRAAREIATPIDDRACVTDAVRWMQRPFGSGPPS
jgi:tetratricopeptide (TPR) repeat protein